MEPVLGPVLGDLRTGIDSYSTMKYYFPNNIKMN
jgi:hypothetical protein